MGIQIFHFSMFVSAIVDFHELDDLYDVQCRVSPAYLKTSV